MAQFSPSTPDAFVDELERQIRDHVLVAMPPDRSGELAAMQLHSVLLTYGNWRSRYVHGHPRTAHLSSKLQATAKLTEHKAAVDSIVAAIKAGDHLTPHLSRGIKTAYVPEAERDKRLHRQGDLDLLISDWGLHHLHLTSEMESDGFVKRTGDLLFAAFTDDDAYLIGIYPHGSWALKELIEILVREWPGNSVLMPSMSGVTLARPVSEEEHSELRKGGVATFVEVDGTVVMPALGMTTAGTPVRVTLHINKMAWALTDLRENLNARLAELDERHPPSDAVTTWEPWVEDETWGLRRGQLRVPIADLW
jgi:hypothetical protein